MSLLRWRFSSFVAGLLALAAQLGASSASPQACCAGSSAATPARLAQHETALAGVQVHAATLFGSFDQNGSYVASPHGVSEYDFEQDLFGAVRVLPRGQLALLVPTDETLRSTPTVHDFGGGLGDINFGARYDFVLAGESRYVPGIALLAGLSVPTGTPPEKARNPLATDSTGLGAFQLNVGLSLEQTFGPWLVGGSFIVAARTPRSVLAIREQLAPQFTGLLYGAYAFDSGLSVAVVGSYQAEGDATLNGVGTEGTARRIAAVSLAGLMPLTSWLKGVLTLQTDLPVFGRNLPALGGFLVTGIASWR